MPESTLRYLFQLPLVIFGLLYGYLIIRNKDIISLFTYYSSKINYSKEITSSILILSFLFILYCAIPSTYTWGIAQGTTDWQKVNNNQTSKLSIAIISVVQHEKYPHIKWIQTDNGSVYQNENPLVLLLDKDDELYVKNESDHREDPFETINIQDIVSIQYLENK
jgi:hypothetical protein